MEEKGGRWRRREGCGGEAIDVEENEGRWMRMWRRNEEGRVGEMDVNGEMWRRTNGSGLRKNGNREKGEGSGREESREN